MEWTIVVNGNRYTVSPMWDFFSKRDERTGTLVFVSREHVNRLITEAKRHKEKGSDKLSDKV